MINVTFEGYFSVKIVLWRSKGYTSYWRAGATVVRGRCHTLVSSVSRKTHLLIPSRAVSGYTALTGLEVRLYQTATEIKFMAVGTWGSVVV